MSDKGSLADLAEQARSRGITRTPPSILLTRWQLLVEDEDLAYFDVSLDSGQDIPGTRYAFLGISDAAICYLLAEHVDEWWEYDVNAGRTSAEITPSQLIAWRRPLRTVSEVSLGGDVRDWLPNDNTHRARNPCVVLKIGDDEVQLPLPSKHRQQSPDISAALACVRKAWAASGSSM